MSDNANFIQGHNYQLSGSGISAAANTVTLIDFTDIYGNQLAMSDFGTIGYIVFEPKTSKAESASFTGVTNNGDNTWTLTGLTRGLSAKPPYTAGGFGDSHSGGAVAIITNSAAFYNELTSKDNDETINGIYTFIQSPIVPTGGTNTQAANHADISNAITGFTGTATNLVAGTTKLSVAASVGSNPIAVGDNDPRVPTVAQIAAMAGDGSTPNAGNKFITQTGLQAGAETYASSTGSANAYVLTLSPIPPTYAAGQIFSFLANFTNTGAATLAVNGQAAKNIYKLNGATALASGDIASGQLVTVAYDGTQFQLLSPSANAKFFGIFKNGTASKVISDASNSQTIAHGLGVIPKYIRLLGTIAPTSSSTCTSRGVYNGTTNSSVTTIFISSGAAIQGSTSNVLVLTDAAGNNGVTGVATFDATNITITWTSVGTNNGASANILWEAFA